MIVLLWLLGVAIVSGQSDCNNCYGHGVLVYSSAYFCRCDCQNNETTSSNGQVTIFDFLGPDCRYTSAQAAEVTISVAQSLSSFSFSALSNIIASNLQLNDTATLYLIGVTVESSQLSVTFQFRDDGPDFNGIQPATYELQLFQQDFNTGSSWIKAAGITSLTPVASAETASYSGRIPILFTVQGYSIPIETFIVLIAIIVIGFALLLTDLLASTNFYRDDNEGRAALAEAKLLSNVPRKYRLPSLVSPRDDRAVPPRAAWVNSAENPVDEPAAPNPASVHDESPLEEASREMDEPLNDSVSLARAPLTKLKSARSYSAQFYSNV